VFTAAQAREAGWTDRTIRRRIAARRWVYVAGQALAEPSERWTAFQLATAAQLTYPQAVISHRTAADLHGFPDTDPGGDRHEQRCDVTFTTRRRAGRSIHVHLLRLERREIIVNRSGLRLTSPSRTAIDCLAGLPFPAALDLWAWVFTRRVLDQGDLDQAIAARTKWHGTTQLRRIRELVAGGAVSAAEFEFHQLLKQARLTGWVANAPITDGAEVIAVIDVAFLAHRVLIEIDGWRAHSSRTSFVSDRRRQNRLVAAGYIVLRFTWDDLIHRPQAVITEIQTTLHQRRHLV